MLEYDGTYSKDFTLEYLRKDIKEKVICYAEKVRSAKQDASFIVATNMIMYISMQQLEFVTYANNNFGLDLDSASATDALKEVYDSYSGKFKQINKNLKRTCVLREIKEIKYYKKNDYKRNILKGDIKSIKYKKYYTPMTNLLALMCVFEPNKYKNLYEGLDFRSALLKYIDWKQEVISNDIEQICIEIENLTDEKEKVRLEHKLNDKKDNVKMLVSYRRIVNDDVKYTRLKQLVDDKRKRVIEKYNTPCEFESLTFTIRLRKQELISEYKPETDTSEGKMPEKKHKVNACINAGNAFHSVGLDNLIIPTIFDRKYHGKMKDYNTKNGNYRVKFIVPNRNDSIPMRLSYSIDGKRIMSNGALDRTGVEGSDLNIKRNQNVFSDGYQNDWNRNYLDELIEIEAKKDKLIEIKKDLIKEISEVSSFISENSGFDMSSEKKTQRKRRVKLKDIVNQISQLTAKEKKVIRKIDADNKRNVVNALVHFNEKHGKGNVHIVLENTDGQFAGGKKIMYTSSKETKISQNKLFRLAGFGRIKDLYISIGSKEKYDVLVTLTHAAHSSRFCLDCGFISADNRKVQELFKCIKCSMKMDADLKAALFLKYTVLVPNVRDALFDYDEEKKILTLKKNLTKEKVLKIYEKYGRDIVSAYHAEQNLR